MSVLINAAIFAAAFAFFHNKKKLEKARDEQKEAEEKVYDTPHWIKT